MRKNISVMPDKKQNKIFSDAYSNTMAEVEKLEKQKNIEDRITILTELFEEDLHNRDLTEPERRQMTTAFKRYIEDTDYRLTKQKVFFTKKKLIGFGATLAIILISGLIYLNTYHPFTSIPEINEELNFYIQKVDDGYGAYAESFYSTLNKYDLKLGEQKTTAFNKLMYTELDEHFDELIVKLESGEIRYYDDAKEWASYFPAEEERDARREIADNAFSKGIGKALDEGVSKFFDKTGNIINRAWDFIKKEAKSILDKK